MTIKFNNKIQNVKIEKIVSAKVNSNIMTEEEYLQLKQNILTNGFIYPIIVRKIEDGFEIVDGHHRLKALKELGATEVPTVVVDMNDKEAIVNAIKFNTERGTQNPKLLAYNLNLLKQLGLNEDMIEKELVYDKDTISDTLDILDLTENEDEILQEQENELDFILYSFVVPKQYQEYVDKVLEQNGQNKGEILGNLCKMIVMTKNKQ